MACKRKINSAAVTAAVVLGLFFPIRALGLAAVMPGLQTQTQTQTGIGMGMEVDCDIKTEVCGWELMEKQEIPISTLGAWYARQTHDRSLCTLQSNGTEYCTCIFECGNGVWTCEEDGGGATATGGLVERGQEKRRTWTWTRGCGKYCHGGVCDGQDGEAGERMEM